MKIIIDDTFHHIDLWEEGRRGEKLFSASNSYLFNEMLNDILTDGQSKDYTENDTHRVFTLSKKKQAILSELIQKNKI